ncbi:bifunctional phosphoribosylaminoimidazolecarboxamide formyltransferase/IMP cyclohydrolase [Synechococcus sp. UW140]|uniref:bifunctional phosphoribosylaminoimidazolecarboxamide formyltransferase/IMP cyclohydrolase n=1 Tax=Synechococcus sp. UW140 TaxID=368503 RepID=UPI0025FC28EC|nr:bifunctional phosphoribosylaminoimidazolecarboxamide formyltransferase/IMP cyclohydrolase [Synechococcus sp. UW140]
MAPLALISVSDKRGVVEFAKALLENHGYQLLSSGGTAGVLAAANLPVTKVADHTGAAEMLGGRVKTLHPRIHGGILARSDQPADLADLEAQQIAKIDLVVVNLYPFEQTVARPDVSWNEAIETIDIGGPAMVRAAAKNHLHTLVLTNPAQYAPFLEALAQGPIGLVERQKLALEAFRHTASYDAAISNWLATQLGENDAALQLCLPLRQNLRYGENPHQAASWYGKPQQGWGAAKQLQGKELSFNNLLDLDAAQAAVLRFPASEAAAAVVVKHTNPCGVALGGSVAEALTRAIGADPISAFGGIVAVNKPLDAAACESLTGLFLECLVAPEISAEARALLAAKPNLRLLELSPQACAAGADLQLRSILGGVLAQQQDHAPEDEQQWQVVTERSPSQEEWQNLRFAWRVVRQVHSNAIVIARNGITLGIGAGQMNRVGSAAIALDAAGSAAQGAAMASDGFFPFSDTVEKAAEFGITAFIQPGGSKRDVDSIAACNQAGLTMVLTGSRHFLH